jgi:hypothetical protein
MITPAVMSSHAPPMAHKYACRDSKRLGIPLMWLMTTEQS